mmetsp:Transcript_1235/g.1946  ORF Transcript_1235/g.1946 Transcript_1235/m.1946 type:complete len:135 (+) Transcript_1235:142-546(+)
MMMGPYWGSSLHYQNCLTGPIMPSIMFGGIFAALDSFQHGLPFRPRVAGTYMAGLYAYNAIQCPMEAIHKRQSLLHNVLSGGLLGYLGVSSGRVGIPFLDPTTIYRSNIRPELIAFAVYGGMAGAFAAFGGKRL